MSRKSHGIISALSNPGNVLIMKEGHGSRTDSDGRTFYIYNHVPRCFEDLKREFVDYTIVHELVAKILSIFVQDSRMKLIK